MASQIDTSGVEQSDRPHRTSAKRCLNSVDLTLIGVGSIIGAGIFVLVGQAAALYAGPGVIISLIISGVCCSFYALCYCELATLMPEGGSAYSYTREAFGQYASWFVAWNLIIEYIFGAAAIAVGWSGYFTSMLHDFGVEISSSWTSSAFTFGDFSGGTATGTYGNILAVLIVTLCTIILVIGVQESARTNDVLAALKIVILLLFIFGGIWRIDAKNFSPLVPENTGVFGEFGASGVLRASSMILFAYIGFDAVSTCAVEAIQPNITVPRGILGSLGISTVLYVATAVVLTGLVPYTSLNVNDPMAVAVDTWSSDIRWMVPLIKIGITIGLTSGVMVCLMGQARILEAMAIDAVALPCPRLAVRRGGGGVPVTATLVAGVLCALVAWALPLSVLGDLVSIGTLIAFAFVCASVIRLRYTQPHWHRPYRVPLYPLVPVLGVLCALGQMASLPPATWIRLVIWVGIGLALLFIRWLVCLRCGRRADSATPSTTPSATVIPSAPLVVDVVHIAATQDSDVPTPSTVRCSGSSDFASACADSGGGAPGRRFSFANRVGDGNMKEGGVPTGYRS